jgi:hypothetical protein
MNIVKKGLWDATLIVRFPFAAIRAQIIKKLYARASLLHGPQNDRQKESKEIVKKK